MLNSLRHSKLAAIGLSALLLTSAAASAASITIGNIELQPNLPGQVVPIYATDSGDVQGLNFVAVVAGGGPDTATLGYTAGTAGPLITAVDITGPGTMFFGNNTGAQDPQQITSQLYTVSTTTIANTVNNTGGTVPLAFVTFDTSGYQSGSSFTFDLAFAEAGQATDFGGIPIDITAGTLTIVPEPASLGMIGLAGLALLRRRRA